MRIYNHKCTLCSLSLGVNTVCMEAQKGKFKALIIGEAPGRNEDEKGKPFIGRAGDELERALKAVKATRSDFYITNVVKCRPPENRVPTHEEMGACRAYLEREIKSIQPKHVLLLGGTAICAALASYVSVGSVRGTWIHVWKAEAMPTYHPAYVMRDSEAGIVFRADIAKFVEKVRANGSRSRANKRG